MKAGLRQWREIKQRRKANAGRPMATPKGTAMQALAKVPKEELERAMLELIIGYAQYRRPRAARGRA